MKFLYGLTKFTNLFLFNKGFRPPTFENIHCDTILIAHLKSYIIIVNITLINNILRINIFNSTYNYDLIL